MRKPVADQTRLFRRILFFDRMAAREVLVLRTSRAHAVVCCIVEQILCQTTAAFSLRNHHVSTHSTYTHTRMHNHLDKIDKFYLPFVAAAESRLRALIYYIVGGSARCSNFFCHLVLRVLLRDVQLHREM